MNLRANGPALNLSSCNLAGVLRDILNKGVSARFRATGFSMSPLIKHGDVLTISPCPPERLRPGDIAGFTLGTFGRLVVHRVVGVEGGSFLLKGDNLAGFDGLIPGSQVLGQITRIERGGSVVRIGLGSERKIIALLSRLRFLPLLVTPARMLLQTRKRPA